MRSTSTLREACERIDYGLTLSATDEPIGPRFLRITDIDSTHVDWGSVPYCDASEAEAVKYALTDGDIVVARTGASTGRSQFIAVAEPAVFASYLVRFRVTSHFEARFISYVLQSNLWSQYVLSVAHGKSAQPNMSARDMGDFVFEHPSLSEQTAIAEVLGALDDKIAVNTEVVQTIESLTHAIYTRGLAGYEMAPLSATADFVNGKAFTKGASGTGRVVLRIAELNSGLGGSTVYSDVEVEEKHIARPGDILFAWSGSLTLSRWYRDDAIVNQHIFKVIPKAGYPSWLVYQLIRAKLAEFKSIAADKATTMGHIQRHHLDQSVAIPSQEEIVRMDAVMSPLWQNGLVAEQESLKLAELRDTLLPELMSGTLRVKDAEKKIEEVV